MSSNFDFLRAEWPDVFEASSMAETYAHGDARTACFLHSVPRIKINGSLGRVTAGRRRQINRRIIAVFRMAL